MKTICSSTSDEQRGTDYLLGDADYSPLSVNSMVMCYSANQIAVFVTSLIPVRN